MHVPKSKTPKMNELIKKYACYVVIIMYTKINLWWLMELRIVPNYTL